MSQTLCVNEHRRLKSIIFTSRKWHILSSVRCYHGGLRHLIISWVGPGFVMALVRFSLSLGSQFWGQDLQAWELCTSKILQTSLYFIPQLLSLTCERSLFAFNPADSFGVSREFSLHLWTPLLSAPQDLCQHHLWFAMFHLIKVWCSSGRRMGSI